LGYLRPMSTCKHRTTAPDHILNGLHEGQEGPQRHKCTECAFEAGYQYGRQNSGTPTGGAECTYTGQRAPTDIIDALPESQAGMGRHKCAVCAYNSGFGVARAQSVARQIGDDVAKGVSDALSDPKPKG